MPRQRVPIRTLTLAALLALWVVGPDGGVAWAAGKPAAPEVLAAYAEKESELLAQMSREGTNSSTLYALGDLCHDAGVDGDKKAVPRAEAYLRQLLSLEATNALAMALLGSVYTLKGRDAFWPTTQIRLVKEGNGYMDRAVKMAPEDVRVRVTRAFNNAHMPDFLGRGAIVHADLEWLWDKVRSEPGLFSTAERQEIALHWGRRLRRESRLEEAQQVWEAGRAFDAESPMARQIAVELTKAR